MVQDSFKLYIPLLNVTVIENEPWTQDMAWYTSYIELTLKSWKKKHIYAAEWGITVGMKAQIIDARKLAKKLDPIIHEL